VSHRCATNFVDYLREFKAIFEKDLTRVSWAQGKLFDEKKLEVENLVSGSLLRDSLTKKVGEMGAQGDSLGPN
jgi:hypothetical protein